MHHEVVTCLVFVRAVVTVAGDGAVDEVGGAAALERSVIQPQRASVPVRKFSPARRLYE
ncbi:MAG: hypothetical protein R3D55_19460 [Chloroflexota bacterium]